MKTKKLLSLLLTLCMLLSAVPMLALPASAKAVTHNITATCYNGKLNFEKTTAAEGETVTVTAKPDEGYDACVIIYFYTSAGGIYTSACLENGENGVYEFVMPECYAAANIVSFFAYFQPKDAWITFTSTESFTLKTANSSVNWNMIIAYSTNESDWKIWNGTEITAAQVNSTGDYHLYLWGYNNTKITNDSNNGTWVLTPTGTNKISCRGNIETLRGASDEKSAAQTDMGSNGCYAYMFKNCTALTTAPTLPATKLNMGCYREMFSGCTSLTTAPELPATTLAVSCYNGMFSGCTSLTTAPELKADTLAKNCYTSMFSGCTLLTTAPELNATALGQFCYQGMFSGCTSLTTAPELKATSLVASCYKEMFKGCDHLYVMEGTADDYTWSIQNSTKKNTVQDMSAECYNDSATVTIPSAGNTNYYKVVGVYDITDGTAEAANGTITIDKTTTFTGDTVTVTATPATDYKLDTVTIKKTSDGTDVTTMVNYDSAKGTFTMPAYDVTVSATFKPAHTHKWTYTAAGATLTATCSVEGHTGGNQSVTLTAPVKAEYNGEAQGVTFDGSVDGITLADVEYYNGETKLKGAPVNAGTYTAKLTKDNAVASVKYEIGTVELIVSGTMVENKKYDGKTAASAMAGNLTDIVNSDDVAIDTVTATFDNANVGTEKDVKVEYTLKGEAKDNYTVKADTLKASISNAALTVSALEKDTATCNSITLKAVEVKGVDGKAVTGATVEYARSENTEAPSEGWQTSTEFDGLEVNTTYYFFVRVSGVENYDDYSSAYAQIATADHNKIAGVAKAVTCLENGVKAHDVCTVCKKIFIDGEEKTALDLVILAKGEHTWGEWEEGVRTCTVEGCGATEECAHEGVKAGETCPECGEKLPSKSSGGGMLSLIGALIAFVLAIISSFYYVNKF